MDATNVTRITNIHLLGFQIPQSVTLLVFFLLILLYCMTISGNLLIITLVSYSKTLRSPMYFFLCHLSVLDIILVTVILPNTISTVLVKNYTMSLSGCLTQFYFFIMAEPSECLLLTVMSWDRYLAICKPLHYALKMNYKVCWTLVILCWILGTFVTGVDIVTISKLQFCGPNVIDHFFCDFDPILQLSCSDLTPALYEAHILGFIFIVTPFSIIIVSYAYIISAIFKMSSITRHKVFSTCSSHLTVVCIYYGTLVCVYLIPNVGQTQTITKLLSLLYTVFTPMINPLIYSLRNQELKKVAGKILQNFLKMY
ncbi:olfactory receptor 10AG1-like [Rana temporaria]|uniref:olfactory receptor 10AG1-like n=1 Tax=Rana temporaria TaxID=8407 RepID=UPI001AACA43C|nr:olfactory receptor 10AG1-like [Rana temporaria]